MTRRRTQLKQRAKRVPGVQSARRRLLRWARGNARLRSAITNVFAIEVTSAAPFDVAPGKVLGGVGVESRPVTLVVILGAEAEVAEAAVDEIARLQLTSAGFRPVIVTDRTVFSTTRRYGYPVELLVASDAWDADEHGMTWEEYARRRIALLYSTYRATASVTIGPAGVDSASRLVLSSLGPARPIHER